MSSQSERIRAVLARSEAPRFVPQPDTPPIAVNTDNLEAFLRSEPAPAQHVMAEPVVEVEEFLPLISVSEATSDATRVTHHEIPLPSRFVAAREKQNRGIPPVVLVFGGLGALAVLVGVLVFAMKDRWFAAAPVPVAAASIPVATEGNSFPLQVKAEPQGNGLIDVRWNPQSSQVAQAREGRLVITEQGQPPRVVDLSSDQLKIGHVSYQAQTERLEFRLEVVDQAGVATTESVLALSTKLNPAAPTQPLPMAKAPDPLQPVRQVARPFTPPPTQSSTPEARAMVLDPPAAVPIGTTGAPGPDVRQTMTNLPTAPVKPNPPPIQTTATPIRTGGKIQPPVLLKKISPAYPQLAKIGHIQGDVRFTATIGKDGKVQNLQVVSGPPSLILAAREAVKQWVYQPSLLNGEPLEVTTEINVNFTLGQ